MLPPAEDPAAFDEAIDLLIFSLQALSLSLTLTLTRKLSPGLGPNPFRLALTVTKQKTQLNVRLFRRGTNSRFGVNGLCQI